MHRMLVMVALHAAGDDSHIEAWYKDTVIGAKFTGHPVATDQFQPARIVVDRPHRPIMAGVKLPWSPVDEWYSFDAKPHRSRHDHARADR